MKKFIFLLALACYWHAGQAQVNVGADKSFQVSINDYKTYGWSKDIDQIPNNRIFASPNGVIIFNNESTRSKIKKAVQYEMDAKGYKYDPNNPDMFVIFQVTEQPGTLRTYNGYQMIDNGFDSVRTRDNVAHTKIDGGTLLINIVDNKSDKVAWQGYASGILKPDMVNDESKVRQAVSTIFNQFKFTAANKK